MGNKPDNFAEFPGLAIEHMDDPVFIKDVNHIWLSCNQRFCDLMGRTKEELIGASDYDFLPKEQADLFWSKDDEVFSTGKMVESLEYHTSSEGIRRYIRTKKSPFKAPDGNQYLVGVIIDITEEKKAKDDLLKSQEQAIEANKAKSRFLANMSHEIRTPLYSIIGFTDLLLQEEHDSNKTELLSAIRSSGSVLLNTINDVLDISKIEEGKATIHNTNFNLKDLINEEVRRFTPLLDKNGNKLVVDVDQSIADYFFGDSLKIRHILNNLLSNANKFTKKGEIKLLVNRYKPSNNVHRQEVRFSIIDSGVGVDKEFIPHLFDQFSQQDSSKTKEYAGTGLGLYIVKSYLKLMKGTIEVDSEIGKGTSISFNLSLPITTGVNHHENLKPVDFLQLKETKILIAEDNPLNQLLIKKVLSTSNLSLKVVDNGKKAVEEADMNQYDLILMDIQMPVMDGFQACERIKKIPAYTDVPIIALTANVIIEDIKAIEKAGMHYMSKPFDLNEFYAKLEELSGKKIRR